MAKKKVKRKIARKKVSLHTHSVKRKIPNIVKKNSLQNRSKFTLRTLILFAVLALISYILYTVTGSTKPIYQDTFLLLAMILGFIALAFLIAFVAISFAKGKIKK